MCLFLILDLMVPNCWCLSDNVLLPKRLVSKISTKIKLPQISSLALDEAFTLAKDKVVQKRRLENELIKEGKSIDNWIKSE